MRLLVFLILLAVSTPLLSQETAVFTEVYESYKKGLDFYNKGLFGLARDQFKEVIYLTREVHEPQHAWIKDKAELLYAQSSVRLSSPEGEMLVENFAREHRPAPVSQQALLEMGNYYYNKRKYDEAIEMLQQIDQNALAQAERNEVIFKLGYCQFVSKDFNAAAQNFRQIKELENEYYYPSNYYYGLTQFFKGSYDEAIYHFQRVRNSRKYDDHIPYYIAQIYFAKGEYDNLLKYALPIADDRSLRNLEEINQLIGQAYYEIGDYEKAVPYFEYFRSRSNRFRPEDYYQIGFVNYKTGNHEEAIRNFEELSRVDSKLGQNAMYYLADSYLKMGDKASARNAFAQASRMKFDEEIQKESLFNFGKLSFELDYGRDALNALLAVKPNDRHYEESQLLLSDLFLKSRDYERAVSMLEGIENKTPKLRETYQKVLYLRGLQLYREEQVDEAKRFFQESLTDPMDLRTVLLATYWLGEIAHRDREYDKSRSLISEFLDRSDQVKELPEEASIMTANYTQGYNYLKEKNYNSALRYFQETVGDIKRQRPRLDNEYVKNQVLGDAVLRLGDCMFKQNRYEGAVQYYDEAIDNQYSGFVYALYQKALIEGLRGNTTEKILALEEISDKYPTSAYSDDALLQLGTVYQELNQLEQAKRPLRNLVTNYRGKSDLINSALLKLGLITYNQGDVRAALSYYQDIFSNNPTPEEAQSALAAVEEIYVDDLNDPDGYIDFLATIPGYNVDTAEKEAISFQAAESQYENGNYEKAISAFNRYLQKYPEGRYSLPSHYYRGESYAVLKQYSEALIDYDYVVGRGLSNYYVKALRKAAIIAEVHEKDYQRAYQYYQQLESAALTDEERFEAQLGAMETAYKAGNMSVVYELGQRVSSNPLATEEQQGTAYFYMGKVALERRNYNDAISAFNQTIKLVDDEKAAESRYQIAYAYYMQRDMQTARELSLNASRENSGYPYWVAKSVILLSDVLAEQGDLFNAKAALEGLLENYDEDPELVKEAQDKLARIRQLQEGSSRLDLKSGDDGLLEMQEVEDDGSGN